jgi:hypothetical protein
MRHMSFSHTTRQFLNGTKTVTRRLGWASIKPGDRFMAVEKSMGLKKGQRVRELGECVCVARSRQRLDAVTASDVVREGFPGVMRRQFVEWFCRQMKCQPSTKVTRIEFQRV